MTGPGRGSARSNRAGSSTVQKYGVRKSSWVTTMFAPPAAAWRIRVSWWSKDSALVGKVPDWSRERRGMAEI